MEKDIARNDYQKDKDLVKIINEAVSEQKYGKKDIVEVVFSEKLAGSNFMSIPTKARFIRSESKAIGDFFMKKTLFTKVESWVLNMKSASGVMLVQSCKVIFGTTSDVSL